MASESVPGPDSYAGIDEYIPLCIKRRRTVRGQPQALVSWRPGWSSCTDTKDPVYATVDSIIKRARDGTLVRWKDSWELESEVCWVPDHATPIPGSSGSRDDGPSGDAGGGENPGDGGEGVKEDSGLSNVPRSTAKGRRIVTPSKRLLESLASRNQQPLPSTASSFSATPRVVTSAVHANPRVPPGPPGQSQSTASTSPPGATGISLQSSGGLARADTIAPSSTPSVPARRTAATQAKLLGGGNLGARLAVAGTNGDNSSSSRRLSSGSSGSRNSSNADGNGSSSGGGGIRRKSSKRQKKTSGTAAPSEFLSYKFEYEAPPSSDGEDLQQEDPSPAKRRVATPSKVVTLR
jgi:hypothetical protein